MIARPATKSADANFERTLSHKITEISPEASRIRRRWPFPTLSAAVIVPVMVTVRFVQSLVIEPMSVLTAGGRRRLGSRQLADTLALCQGRRASDRLNVLRSSKPQLQCASEIAHRGCNPNGVANA